MTNRKLSTEANIGKVLVIIAVIIGIITTVITIFMGVFGMGFGMHMFSFGIPRFLSSMMLVLGTVKIAGIVLGVYSYKSIEKKDVHQAGIYALVASFLPPLDIIMLIGAILLLISKEAKK